uniref:Uncharacterized protein n=1 Tax=Anopheles atroparvus TaxID=41427 RepID=A0A182JLT9_ANOAO
LLTNVHLFHVQDGFRFLVSRILPDFVQGEECLFVSDFKVECWYKRSGYSSFSIIRKTTFVQVIWEANLFQAPNHRLKMFAKLFLVAMLVVCTVASPPPPPSVRTSRQVYPLAYSAGVVPYSYSAPAAAYTAYSSDVPAVQTYSTYSASPLSYNTYSAPVVASPYYYGRSVVF